MCDKYLICRCICVCKCGVCILFCLLNACMEEKQCFTQIICSMQGHQFNLELEECGKVQTKENLHFHFKHFNLRELNINSRVSILIGRKR